MVNAVALISSYKEGRLIQGTIHSLVAAGVFDIVIFDGPTKPGAVVNGDKTDIGRWNHRAGIVYEESTWPNEHTKRTAMLQRAREVYPLPEFWILTIDADEILVWGEYLTDWLNVLRPEKGEVVVPLKRTEAQWTETGFLSDVAPSRLIHSSIVKEYLVSCWKILTPKDEVFFAGHYRAPKMPMYGEPHIHHRSYLRRIERAVMRESRTEEYDYVTALKNIAEGTAEERDHTKALQHIANHVPDVVSELESIMEKKGGENVHRRDAESSSEG